MAEKTKNLCAQIPESLHDTVRSHQMESGKTMNAYMTELLTYCVAMHQPSGLRKKIL